MSEPVRCPICMDRVRELLKGQRGRMPHYLLARAERIVARATCWAPGDMQAHLVGDHGWRPYTGTLREGS